MKDAKLLVFGVLLASSFSIEAAAGQSCSGPVTGSIQNTNFDFTYESWQKKQTDSGLFRFERCVYNNHSRPVWVDWESTGLKGTTESNDASFVFFDEPKKDKEEIPRSLWYGPVPDKIEPTTVLRPIEASKIPGGVGSVSLVQFEGEFSLADAFQDRKTLTNILEGLDSKTGIGIWSGGRIGVPTRDGALEDLGNINESIDPADFAAVEVLLGERLFLSDGVPFGRLVMEFSVDPEDYATVKATGRQLPSISISTDNEMLRSRLLPVGSSFEFLAQSWEFEDRSPAPLEFPVQRAEGDVVIEFGDGAARLVLPFGVASGQ